MSGPVLGLIPARGGSKGIPRKNIQSLGGRPLLAFTVEAARGAKSLDRVIVSTDDEQIAAVASAASAEVPFLRPAEYARDDSSSMIVIHHALAWLAAHEGYRPEAVALLSPTCPFRSASHIDAVVHLLWVSGFDSAVTARQVENHPYSIFTRTEDGRMVPLLKIDNPPLRRQDLPPYLTYSQAVIVSRTTYLETSPSTASVVNYSSVGGVEVDWETAFDIDTPLDLEIAAMMMRRRQATG